MLQRYWSSWAIAAAAVVLAAVGVLLLRANRHGRGAPLEEQASRAFHDAGVQMEVPSIVASKTSDTNGVLLMWRVVSRADEPEYCVNLYVCRISKAEMDSNIRVASRPSTDAFNKWRSANHPTVSVRKDEKFWHVRKDVDTSNGQRLLIDCDIRVTQFAEMDLFEVERIVESVKPLR
jgi:hypothetical protein